MNIRAVKILSIKSLARLKFRLINAFMYLHMNLIKKKKHPAISYLTDKTHALLHISNSNNTRLQTHIFIQLLNPLLPEFFCSFSENSPKYALFVYRLIVATLIGIFFMIPSLN